MRKVSLLLSVVSSCIMANSTVIATKSCEAYNNMKHTTNTSHIVLQPNQSYTSVREYKGKILSSYQMQIQDKDG